ncbi:MAG: PLP-dependent transferase [Kiritimatiellae bacterium]|nr:PLP-dependent transferase [Kiritimatiellia bacterium]
MTPDRELITKPCWRPEDLGAPLPDLPHANSVCLPTWQDVVHYEEKNPRVMDRLRAGYPRFVVPPPCAHVFALAQNELCAGDERCHLYSTQRAAERCVERIQAWCGATARTVEWPKGNMYAVCFPASAADAALKYWRHTGDGISSRRAQALLDGTPEPDATEARAKLQRRIAEATGVTPDCVYFFRSGMAAIYTIYRAMVRRTPGQPLIQLGFPYVDTLKILQDFGTPHVFLPHALERDINMLHQVSLGETIAGLLCEFPSNPVLISADLTRVREISLRNRFPIVIDDTISTWINVDLMPVADAIVTSLTKWFTGRGDVMGGSVVLNPRSPFADELRAALDAEYEDCTWGESLILAEELSRDANVRVRQSTATASAVAEWLRKQSGVEAVYYPQFKQSEMYDRFRRPDGGYGGLFSFTLKNPEKTSECFYNALEISKGPNLGTTFSLCCPFTLLAHYGELDWAEQCGVPRWLMRLSIGLETADDLIARIGRALDAAR